MLSFCEDIGVASCSAHILCSYNLTLGSISSVYPDSVNGQGHSTDCSIILISSYSILRCHLFTSSGMVLDPYSLTGGVCEMLWAELIQSGVAFQQYLKHSLMVVDGKNRNLACSQGGKANPEHDSSWAYACV
jgi:hypothetical protein